MLQVKSKSLPFSQQAINLNQSLKIPKGLSSVLKMMNPFDEKFSLEISSEFYKKFYFDAFPRSLILGINPGRHGAGITGIPFTDSQRLESDCGIYAQDLKTYEPSSVFIYKVIEALGGSCYKFYRNFYFSSCCPLGLLKKKGKNWVNYNYYDDAKTQKLLEEYIVNHLKNLQTLHLKMDVVFCLGSGKNLKFLKKINQKYSLFGEIIPLDHPRYVMQYRFNFLEDYIQKYCKQLAKRVQF